MLIHTLRAAPCALALLLTACEELPDTAPDPTRQCKPGVYEGKFEGWYTPPATIGVIPVPVSNDQSSVEAGLRFVLEPDPASPTKMVVRAGCIQGFALGSFPFHARMLGSVDCSTATLTSVLDGWYDAFEILFFKGTATGLYDVKQAKFVGGKWQLNELDANDVESDWLGGDGTWSATWVRDAPDAGVDEACQGF